MRILFRYVFREFCVPLAYCLTGFLSVYVLFELFGVFNRMMEAHVAAILSYLNTNVIGPDEEPFTEETVSWDYVQAEFDWPKGLFEKQ